MTRTPIDGRLAADAAPGLARAPRTPGEISLRQLTKHAAAVIDDLEHTGPLVVTRAGRPVARLAPLDDANDATDRRGR